MCINKIYEIFVCAIMPDIEIVLDIVFKYPPQIIDMSFIYVIPRLILFLGTMMIFCTICIHISSKKNRGWMYLRYIDVYLI